MYEQNRVLALRSGAAGLPRRHSLPFGALLLVSLLAIVPMKVTEYYAYEVVETKEVRNATVSELMREENAHTREVLALLANIHLYRATRGERCTDRCQHADDGFCDDGGVGSEFDACGWGTDCADCGSREDLPLELPEELPGADLSEMRLILSNLSDADVVSAVGRMRDNYKDFVTDGVRFPSVNIRNEEGHFRVLFHADPNHWEVVDVDRGKLVKCPTYGLYETSICDVVQLDAAAWNMVSGYGVKVISYQWYNTQTAALIVKQAYVARLSLNAILWGGISSSPTQDDPLLDLSVVAIVFYVLIYAGLFLYPAVVLRKTPRSLRYIYLPAAMWLCAMSSLAVLNLKSDFKTIDELDSLLARQRDLTTYMLFACFALLSQLATACKCPDLTQATRASAVNAILFACIAVTFIFPVIPEDYPEILRLQVSITRIAFVSMSASLICGATASLYVIAMSVERNPTVQPKSPYSSKRAREAKSLSAATALKRRGVASG